MIYNLAVNYKMKKEIYFNYNIKELVKPFIFYGNVIETSATLQLIGQLSFNAKIALDLEKDEELMEFLNQSYEDNIIESLCKKIKWNINMAINKQEDLSKKNISKGKHIMISHKQTSKVVCDKVKKDLENLGYKVSIDTNDDDISDTRLEDMVKAVEEAFCVLICVTEKYRKSFNRQLEARYASRLNKPIIPLIMQDGYENVSGWLGFLIGDNIKIDFIRQSYERSFRKLEKQIEEALSAPVDMDDIVF